MKIISSWPDLAFWTDNKGVDVCLYRLDKGLFKKKCQLSCSIVFCWSLLLFYSDMVHKQWLKVWFLTSLMPVLSVRINFVSFSTTSKNNFSNIPMKYSKIGQKFAKSKNPSNMLFETCWILCKKPHFFMWSRSRYTFFWMTRYLLLSWWRGWCLWTRGYTYKDGGGKYGVTCSSAEGSGCGWKLILKLRQESRK